MIIGFATAPGAASSRQRPAYASPLSSWKPISWTLPDARALETLYKPRSLPTMRTSVLHYTAEVTLPL